MARLDSATLEEQAARIRELLDADREDAILWFGLGQTLLSLGRPGDAIEAFEAATRLDPDYTAAFRDLGRAHLENANPSEAARLFAEAYRVTSVPLAEYVEGMFSTPEVLVKGDVGPECIRLLRPS